MFFAIQQYQFLIYIIYILGKYSTKLDQTSWAMICLIPECLSNPLYIFHGSANFLLNYTITSKALLGPLSERIRNLIFLNTTLIGIEFHSVK